jgi:hypothetical protein
LRARRSLARLMTISRSPRRGLSITNIERATHRPMGSSAARPRAAHDSNEAHCITKRMIGFSSVIDSIDRTAPLR